MSDSRPANVLDDAASPGAMLTALLSSPDHRDCLEVFADALKAEALAPLLLTVLVEPRRGAQILAIGHAYPGLPSSSTSISTSTCDSSCNDEGDG
jgi:hypothetical protein